MTDLTPHLTLIVPFQHTTFPLDERRSLVLVPGVLEIGPKHYSILKVAYNTLSKADTAGGRKLMAKRSDFAQKLLDDLRLRKERMAASHDQRSNQSNHLPIDAYAYTKQTYRGSRNAKENEIVGSRSGEMAVNRCSSSRGHRSVNSELSNQIIIPYGKGGQSESQALALAFENGVKLRRADLSYTNSIMGFLHQITKRGTMERASNLERQLASTSHHYPYPTLSLVQMNEISKGAQKLNHTLRACSNGPNMDTYSLQFAKELLQGAIDLEDSLRVLMLVDLQKSSQFMITPQQQAKNKNRITLLEEDNEEDDERMMQRQTQLAGPIFSFGKMQRPITVTNSKEARKIKSSSSSGADISERKRQTASKGRIPNVIAKLMGLEDNLPLPEKKVEVLLKKDSSSKHTAKAKGYKASIKKSQNVAEEVMMGRKQDHPNNSNREQKGTVKGRTNDPVLNLNNKLKLEQVRERSQVKSSIQVVKEINASIIQPEKGHALTNKHVLSNENKSRNQLVGVQKSCSYVLSKNRPQEEQTFMLMRMRAQGGRSEMTTTPKNSSKPSPQKKQPSINQPTPFKTNHYLVKDEASNDTNGKVKEISSPRDQEFERAKGRHGIKTMTDEKHVHKLASRKIKQKVDQMLTARNGQGKQEIPNLQEVRDRASGKLNGAVQERFIEADAPINIIIPTELQLPPTLYSSGGGEFQSRQESANDLRYQDVQSVAVNLPDQATPGAVDYGFKTGDGEVALWKTIGTQEDGMGVNHSKLQDQNTSEISIQQPLTESENCLKWILVMSQLFVNTAEALFRLTIPFSVLQGGRQDNQDHGSKLTLDCGYEVMKRKGIRQELKVHNCSKISISTVNIRSLDDLVRKLNEDMEKLTFYGRKKGTQVYVEDYVPKMLEHDVYDKYPDTNCMWDFGWNDETFAFIEKYDVIRDTEKHILSVLLDEITKDCCMFNED